MGLCEKCDDRASGRLDCDLTSEREKNRSEREEKRERGRKRMRGVVKEWFSVGEDKRGQMSLKDG